MATTQLLRKTKDPNSILDYTVDWTQWLEKSSNDVIISVVWIVPPGITKTNQDHSDTLATVWLSGGTLKKLYQITCRITTSGSRTEDYSFELVVSDK